MIGFYTYFKREVARFMQDALNTIAPSATSVILYIMIFGVALATRLGLVEGQSYTSFMMPGLILVSVITNSFYNPAFSILQSRLYGNIADVLSSPLATSQIALAVILAGMLRGLVVGTLIILTAWLVLGFQVQEPLFTLLYLLIASMAFAALGSIAGLWTHGWEGVNVITVFFLDPLVLLGGVFYSLEMLQSAPLLKTITEINPFTTIIGGLRAAMIGTTEISVESGLLLTGILALIFVSLALLLFHRGYHLKA
jgi:ABC-2 type transport system permease protein